MNQTLVAILQADSEPDRTWCGNDTTGNFTWHGGVPSDCDPVVIKLSWKSDHGAPDQYIGTFVLHLARLLEHGYIGHDAPGQVRVRFINDKGVIKLSMGADRPSIVLGVRVTR